MVRRGVQESVIRIEFSGFVPPAVIALENDTEIEWQAAMGMLVLGNMLCEEDARTFLDSRMGRHLANALIDIRVMNEDKGITIASVEQGGLQSFINWWKQAR